MSVEAMALVLHHSRAKGAAKVILLGIANHEGDGGSWPTLTTLAKYANVNVRNAREALRKLEAMGELTTLTQGGGLRGHPDETRPNLYRVTVRCPGDCDGTAQHRTATSRRHYPLTLDLGPAVDNLPGYPRMPATGGEDASDPPPPDASDRGGRSPATAEPSCEPSPESQPVADVADQRAGIAREARPVDCGQPDPVVPCPPDLAASIRSQLTREEVTTR